MGFRFAEQVFRAPRRDGTASQGPDAGAGIGIDPRYYQLAVQSGLLLFGVFRLQLEVSAVRIAAVVVTAVLLQWFFTRCYRLAPNVPSALNTSLSILLLLRSDGLLWLLLAVAIAIAGKFLVTSGGRHIFNPSAFGILLVILVADGAWVTPGQWGHEIWLALLAAGSGLVVLLGPDRMATTLAFGAVYPLLLLANAAWLGDPWQIPLHRLQNGALLIFAFFMLSDPKTVPAAVVGCILYGTWVAVLGWGIGYYYYLPNAFLYALILSSPLVPALNHWIPGRRFVWPGTGP